jgi:hypothetical protein
MRIAVNFFALELLVALLGGGLTAGGLTASAAVSLRAMLDDLDPKLPASPSWTYYATQIGAELGQAVAPAGDVNGDGYADVIVTAPKFTDTTYREGVAMVFHGGPSGLSRLPVWMAGAGQRGSYYGGAAHTVFDVNGDGYDDIIVGAPQYNNGFSEEGAAFVYYGSHFGLSHTHDWAYAGGKKDAQFGTAVGPAGDVNGDGYPDVVVGARRYSDQHTWEGALFIFYGSADGLSSTPNQVFYGGQPNAQLGQSAITAGDINGDGYADVIAGAPYYPTPNGATGALFVYLGSPTGLAPAPESPIVGLQDGMRLGHSVYPAGDLNGDGYADVIVGAPGFSGDEAKEGAAFVYFGTAAGLYTAPIWALTDGHEYAYFGMQVGSTGLFPDGDFGALLVGAPNYRDDQPEEGRLFVYLNRGGGCAPAFVWKADGDKAEAHLATSVAAVGDINGNGLSDLMAGAPQFRYNQNITGRAFAYYVLASDEQPVYFHFLPLLQR